MKRASKVKWVAPQPASGLLNKLRKVLKTEKDYDAVEKDMLLIEAAQVAEKIIFSRDENSREPLHFAAATADELRELRSISWLNPDFPENDDCISWMENGCPVENYCKLGYVDNDMREDLRRVIDRVSAWEGVEVQPHRFGGVEFLLGKVEIGHIHLDAGLVDIPFTRRTREALVSAEEAELHHILPESDWISFWLHDTQDVDPAIRLYRLSYLQKRFRRAPDDAAFQTELSALHFGAAITGSLTHPPEDE